MARIKYSNFISDDYSLFDYELQREYDLNDAETQVFGFIRRHCFTFKKNNHYWCGLSDANIAKRTNKSVRMLKRHLSKLKEKGLIVIENSRTGYRKIYLNDALYLDQDVSSVQEIALTEQLKEKDRKIEQLEAEIKRLKNEQRVERTELYPSLYIQQLIDAQVLQPEDVAHACVGLDEIYNIIKAEFHGGAVFEHIKYMINQFKSKDFKKPNNVVQYLQSSAINRYEQLKYEKRKNQKITQKPNNFDDDEQLSFDF